MKIVPLAAISPIAGVLANGLLYAFGDGTDIYPDKTTIMRAPYRQTVTGLVLGENGPRIQKQYLRRVRAMLHNANQQVSSGKIIKNIDEIKGKLAFIKMVMPNTFKKLTRKYDWLYQ